VTLHDITPFVIVAIVVIAMIGKQLRGLGSGYNALVERQRAEALQAAQASGVPAAAAARSDVAAVLKAAVAAYEAAPAYSAAHSAAPPAYRPAQQHRPARVAPVARSVDIPIPPVAAVAPAAGWVMADAFRSHANARTAVVMAEILGPPRALR
jgi:hypothetical protein